MQNDTLNDTLNLTYVTVQPGSTSHTAEVGADAACCVVGLLLNALDLRVFCSRRLRGRCSGILAFVGISNALYLAVHSACVWIPWAFFNCRCLTLTPTSLNVYLGLVWLTPALNTAPLLASAWLCVERYYAVCRPLFRLHKRTFPPVSLGMVGVSLAAALQTLLRVGIYHCWWSWHCDDDDIIEIVRLAIFLVLPSVIVLASSCAIAVTLLRRPAQRETLSASCADDSVSALKIVLGTGFCVVLFSVLPELVHTFYAKRISPVYLLFKYVRLVGLMSPDTLFYLTCHPGFRREALQAVCCARPRVTLRRGSTAATTSSLLSDASMRSAFSQPPSPV